MTIPPCNWLSKVRKGSKFECSICDKHYKYEQNLENHTGKAHGIKQEIAEDISIDDHLDISEQLETNSGGNFMDEVNLVEDSLNKAEGRNTWKDPDIVMTGLE